MTNKCHGSAQKNCIENAEKQDTAVHFLFHNFSRYKSHLIFKNLINILGIKKIKVIPQISENYMSLAYGCIRLLDSRGFLTKSFDELSGEMKDDDYVFQKSNLKLIDNHSLKNLFILMVILTIEMNIFDDIKELKKEDHFSKLN